MVKASSFNQNGFKKGAWSEDEDDKLRAYITRYGHWNWGLLPKFAGLSRSGKSCRLRWMNYLRPDMKHGNFTIEEDDVIVDLHSKLGNKWSAIAAKLPGRSDNEIKNRWNVHLKKRAQLDQTDELSIESTPGTMNSNNIHANDDPKEIQDQELPSEGESLSARALCDHESSPSSSSCSDQLTSYWLSGSDYAVLNDNTDDFWAEPFLPDITSTVNSMSPSLDTIDDFIISGYSCQDTMMTDEFTWSMLDSHFEYMNSEFMS